MNEDLKILLLEDEPADASSIFSEVKKTLPSFSLHVVDSKEDFTKELLFFNPHLVLSDHSLPNFNSLEALKIARNIDSDIPFIIVSGMISSEFVTDCINAGADDYVSKNSLVRLPVAIQNALNKNKIRKEKDTIESLYNKLQHAYNLIEEKNKNIMDSVRYALNIQQSMLPNPSELKALFSDSFVLYSPKDIVSGDFYWFRRIENKILVAVADCTGHGVPGALMSMMGNELLNDIIVERKIFNPAEILNTLRTRLIKTLNNNHGNSHETMDGMDIALCNINLEKNKLQFAGAYHSLWMLRDAELIKVKGDKFPIGTFLENHTQDFTFHEIEIKKSDCLYLFSDGYASQFGGEKGKKFSYKRLLNFFIANHTKTMEEQKQLLELIHNVWRGSLEQVDDILTIGIRI